MSAPRTLSPEAQSTTDSIIHSVDKPILRVSHAMLCQEAPKRYPDTKFSKEWLAFVPAPRALSPEDGEAVRRRALRRSRATPRRFADTQFSLHIAKHLFSMTLKEDG